MSKRKGTAAERELLKMFWEQDWGTIRIAGSGCSRLPAPDLLAGNGHRRMAIECKSTKSTKQYISKEQLEQLREFSSKFGAEAWVAIRFDRKRWYFLNPEDLRETNKAYGTTLKRAEDIGLTFKEVLGQF